ncbi:hypothetical protein SAGO17_0010 [Mimivirus AB-566-O17]|uniref:Uncharacterized protein n=1 Tax=Mimivirus AB-566-O17 TaxID=1988039 RepID=A0A1X9VNN1_9VIRU|nr:hypothetical protein SAGO17_0010 [Mimivirus AB-566-O17]
MERNDPLSINVNTHENGKISSSENSVMTDSFSSENDRVGVKMNTFKLNNYWNNKNEKLVAELGEKSNAYQWLHNKSARRYFGLDKIIGVVITILAAIVSIESQLPQNESFRIITNILKFMIFVVSSINIFLNYQELSEKHKQSGVKFQNLYNRIEEEVSQYKQLRSNAVEFLRDCNKVYTSVISESPNISARELKEFKNTFKNSSISKPTILDSLTHIVPVKSKGIERGTPLQDMAENLCTVVKITDDITDEDIINIKSEQLKFQTERLMNQI